LKKPNPKVKHIRNERLVTVKPGYRGNKIVKGAFANGDEVFKPAMSDVLKWKLSSNPQRLEKKEDDYTPPVVSNTDFLTSDQDMVVWLGHASFFIRLNGITFIIDPVFYDIPMVKRRVGLPCDVEQFKGIDFLLLSHAHYDHLDKKSIQALYRQNPNLKVLAPLKVGKLLRSIEPHLPYQEAGWFQQYDLLPDGVEIFFTPASHWHRRGAFDINKMLWGSFVLKTQNTMLYFAGDTGLNTHFEEIQEVFGPMDICIMPVGAYRPSFMMQKSHLNPHEAVKAFNHLRGGTFIPMHYGTFDLSDEPPSEPVRLLQEIAAGGMLQDLRIPAIGEPLLIRDLVAS
jgi:L-ascorbate metabolism protein UlaG (beta-lactamase superfamily)